MIREKDGIVFVIQPRCVHCGGKMIRDRVAGRMGAYGTDSLSFTPVATLIEMIFRCRKDNTLYRLPYSEISIINQYPITNQKLVDK